jgi:hypothetical protein
MRWAPEPSDGSFLGYLAGEWALRRSLVDAASGRSGSFDGAAVVTPDPAGADYREDGWLRWPSYAGPAGRSLRYEYAAGGGLLVRFADGRPFHRLDVAAGAARFRHDCGADVYLGTLVVLGPDEWHQDWSVRGPDKQLEISSVYRRGPAQPRSPDGTDAGAAGLAVTARALRTADGPRPAAARPTSLAHPAAARPTFPAQPAAVG